MKQVENSDGAKPADANKVDTSVKLEALRGEPMGSVAESVTMQKSTAFQKGKHA